MGELSGPLVLPMVWFYYLFFLGQNGQRLYFMVFDEDRLGVDPISVFFRTYPLGPPIALVTLLLLLILYTAVGAFDSNPPETWKGFGEFTLTMIGASLKFNLNLWYHIGFDVGFAVGFGVFACGMALGLLKAIIYAVGLYDSSWNSTLPICYLFLGALSYGSKRYLWRRKSARYQVVPSRTTEELIGQVVYVVRFRKSVPIMLFSYWIFQIEHFFQTNQPGLALMLLYYVIAMWMLIGCCNEFRENET